MNFQENYLSYNNYAAYTFDFVRIDLLYTNGLFRLVKYNYYREIDHFTYLGVAWYHVI